MHAGMAGRSSPQSWWPSPLQLACAQLRAHMPTAECSSGVMGLLLSRLSSCVHGPACLGRGVAGQQHGRICFMTAAALRQLV
jgi:hypothetical protein